MSRWHQFLLRTLTEDGMDGSSFVDAVSGPDRRISFSRSANLLLCAPDRDPAHLASTSLISLGPAACVLSLGPFPSPRGQMANERDMLINIGHDITEGRGDMQVSDLQ